MKIIFSGGGTAGHINPAVAIADFVSKKEPCTISFCGGKGNLEETLVPRLGYEIDTFPMRGLSRGRKLSDIQHNIEAIADMERATEGCKRIIKQRSPDIVIGTGGYASFPMVNAAIKCGVKTAVFEANAVAGVAVKRLARKADCVLLAYGDTASELKAQRVEVTGSPVRSEIIGCYKTRRQELFRNDLPIVLSFWGSVGARFMNEKMIDYLAIAAKEHKFNHIHASGKGYYETMRAALEEKGVLAADNIILKDYIYNMGEVMAQADMVVCRAGGTLSELCVAGMPAILVPSPYVAENHQERNARVLERAGAARLLKEADAEPETIFRMVSEMVGSRDTLASMSGKALSLGHPDALERIYDTIKSIIG